MKNRLVPPSFKLKNEIIYFVVALLLLIVFPSLEFFSNHKELLKQYMEFGYIYMGFTLKSLFGNSLKSFWLYLLLCILQAVRFYRYFYTESKSIYLMKRLKNKNEVFVRTCLFSIIAALIGIVVVIAIYYLCGYYYLRFTPAEWIPLDFKLNIWEVLL